jgi:hypothetical protein
MAATQTFDTHVTLTQEEKDYLVRVLQNAIGETRVEAHHTHTPQYRERVLDEEKLIRGLLTKVEKSA